jgi:hypothetical protein
MYSFSYNGYTVIKGEFMKVFSFLVLLSINFSVFGNEKIVVMNDPTQQYMNNLSDSYNDRESLAIPNYFKGSYQTYMRKMDIALMKSYQCLIMNNISCAQKQIPTLAWAIDGNHSDLSIVLKLTATDAAFTTYVRRVQRYEKVLADKNLKMKSRLLALSELHESCTECHTRYTLD